MDSSLLGCVFWKEKLVWIYHTYQVWHQIIIRSAMNIVDITWLPTRLFWKDAWYLVFVLWKYTIPAPKKKTPLIFQASCRRTWIPATSGREFDAKGTIGNATELKSEGQLKNGPKYSGTNGVEKKTTNKSLRFMSRNSVIARSFFNQDQTQWSGKSKLRKNMFPFRQSWKNCWIIPAPSKGCQLNLI